MEQWILEEREGDVARVDELGFMQPGREWLAWARISRHFKSSNLTLSRPGENQAASPVSSLAWAGILAQARISQLVQISLSLNRPLPRLSEILKGYVKNRSRPEGCISERYIVEEALDFFTGYLEDGDFLGIPKPQYAKGTSGEGITMCARSWKPRLIQRFSLERERCIWEGEILGYTGGFSPERELYHPGEKWQFWAV
ncbi:hypothetical protein Lal_00025666 [Lupinus albus]|nr:hypothetical protein Lal_00025666 [Lupinus albus]